MLTQSNTLFARQQSFALRRNLDMDNKAAIGVLAALSHERRLSVFHLLNKRGMTGMNAGAIAEALEVPPSSLSFHLTHLEQSGLISSRRFKRQIIYSVVPERLASLVIFLTEEGAIGNSGFYDKIVDEISDLKKSTKKNTTIS